MDFDTLDKFCTTFGCNTLDLIEHTPDKNNHSNLGMVIFKFLLFYSKSG
ncbi:hypothetical protein C2I27_19355 [Priestia megaterium]|nr:helix-turn-helix transcriptional regulator [Bacillus sp. FJAT-26377]PVC65523.1 hypothetical protein C2I27_19355 [Priestia megaterium]